MAGSRRHERKSVCATAFVLILFACRPLHAEEAGLTSTTVETFMSRLLPEARATLEAEGELISVGESLTDLKYGLQSPWSSELRRAWSGRKTTVVVEGLFVCGVGETAKAEDRLIQLVNALGAVSTMKGVQYKSVLSGKQETLIIESYRTTRGEDGMKLRDPVFDSVPDAYSFDLFQKENRMGDVLSQVTISRCGDSVSVAMENISKLSYRALPLVKPGDMRMYFFATPLPDRVVVYGMLGANARAGFGMERMAHSSFRHRMEAMSSWLRARITSFEAVD